MTGEDTKVHIGQDDLGLGTQLASMMECWDLSRIVRLSSPVRAQFSVRAKPTPLGVPTGVFFLCSLHTSQNSLQCLVLIFTPPGLSLTPHADSTGPRSLTSALVSKKLLAPDWLHNGKVGL